MQQDGASADIDTSAVPPSQTILQLVGHIEAVQLEDRRKGAPTSSCEPASAVKQQASAVGKISYRTYRDEDDIPIIVDLIAPYLSEPYSIYCYRYFLHGWPKLCILAYQEDIPVGVIVCKQDLHRGKLMRGYIAMLATKPEYRKYGIATTLVEKAIAVMKRDGAQEVVLETEVSNEGALRLYERLGFIRLKRLYRFYLNASDAFRLCLPIPEDEWQPRRPADSSRDNQDLPPELQHLAEEQDHEEYHSIYT